MTSKHPVLNFGLATAQRSFSDPGPFVCDLRLCVSGITSTVPLGPMRRNHGYHRHPSQNKNSTTKPVSAKRSVLGICTPMVLRVPA